MEEGRFNFIDGDLILKELQPGFRYTISVKNIEEKIEISAVTSCSCENHNIDKTGTFLIPNNPDKTGRPQKFSIRQERGHVMFQFEDNSHCEEGEYTKRRF